MSIPGVETVICNRLGLDPAALGSSVLPRTIDNRMKANGVTTAERYLELLTADPSEIEALAAELVVSETWFFRGGQPLFQKLAQFVADRASGRPRGFPVRALSLPCSTGEEPYSLAIALHESGLPSASYQIEGADLSRSHVKRATAGVYSAFAFREPGTDIRPTYFRQSGIHWIPLPHIRRAVRFRVGNVTDPMFFSNELPYDLILCRNLFIYLTAEGRKRAIATLDRLLAPDGRLCVTPAEADRLPPGQFVPEGPIEFGLFRRVTPASGGVSVAARPNSVKLKPTVSQRSTAISDPLPLQPPIPALSPVVVSPSLDQARTLANAGRLAEARVACEELIRSQVELPEAYALLGVIHQAEGHASEAVEAFRRTLYLAPNHLEALTHMIVLCKTRGDASQAAALQKRLKRLAAEDQA